MPSPRASGIGLFIVGLVALAVVFALGFFAGFAVRQDLSDNRFGAGSEDDLARLALITRLTGERPAMEDVREFSTPVEVALNALAIRGDRHDEAARELLFAAVPLRQINDAVTFVGAYPEGLPQRFLRDGLLDRWGFLNGRSALGFARQLEPVTAREAAVQAALGGWARRDPESAWAWLQRQTQPPSGGYPTVLAVWTQRDAEAARQALTEAPPEFHPALQTTLIRSLLEARRLQTARDIAAATPADQLPPAALLAITEAWRPLAPRAALDWLAALPATEARDTALAASVAAWTAVQPEAAANWVRQRDDPAWQEALLPTVVAAWVNRGDLDALSRWLNAQPAETNLDASIATLAQLIAPVAPDAALIWASTLSDPAWRDALMIELGEEWRTWEPASAEAFLRDDPRVPAAVRTYFSADAAPPSDDGDEGAPEG